MIVEQKSEAIHGLMVKIMSEVGPISKDRKNQSQGYSFRGVDDVYEALQAIMAKHGVYTTSEILDDRSEERQSQKGANLIYRILKLRYWFHAPDGSKVPTDVIGEGMDSGDKASNKAMSVGHKYACLQAFMIPTKESKDPEDEHHEVKPKEGKADVKAAPATQPAARQEETKDKKTQSPREVAAAITKSFAAFGKQHGMLIDRTMVEKIALAPLDQLKPETVTMLRNLLADLQSRKTSVEQVFGRARPAASELNDQFS